MPINAFPKLLKVLKIVSEEEATAAARIKSNFGSVKSLKHI